MNDEMETEEYNSALSTARNDSSKNPHFLTEVSHPYPHLSEVFDQPLFDTAPKTYIFLFHNINSQ